MRDNGQHIVTSVEHLILGGQCVLGAYNKHGRLVLGLVVKPRNLAVWSGERNLPVELRRMRREFEMTYSEAEQQELMGPVPPEEPSA